MAASKPITTSDSKKGAVSLATQAANALLAAQNKVTVANLQASDVSLLSKVAALNKDIALLTAVIPYTQAVIVNNKWGTNEKYNYTIYEGAKLNTTVVIAGSTTYSSQPGLSPDAADIVKIAAYLTSITAKLASDKAQVATITATIAANVKKIDAINSGKGTGGGGGGTQKPKPGDNSQSSTPKPPPQNPTSDYLWNLPPHAWSLPIDPNLVNLLGNEEFKIDTADTTSGQRLKDISSGDLATKSLKNSDYHINRLGRIWFYNGYAGASAALDYTSGGQFAGGGGTGSTGVSKASVNKYGFQFMWNPETYNQSTSVNMQITPSNTDPTIALTGFAAANSQMSFTLRIDRTNDFACAKKLAPASVTNSADLSKLASYYTIGNRDASFTKNPSEKILDLLNYGTEADLEYLYRVINGDTWVGIGGRRTANIGYLMPALIRVDLGNQKFVGVVSALDVNHLAFTGDMVPIRSDVNVSIDLRANIQPTTNLTPKPTPAAPKK